MAAFHSRRRVAAALLSAGLFALTFAARGSTPEPAQSGVGGEDCLSCHHALLDGRKPHLPAKSSSCLYCHKPAEPAAAGKCKSAQAASWTFVAAQPALCATCHDTTHAASHVKPAPLAEGAKAPKQDPALVFGAGAWHPVIKSQGCTACHDPHASSHPALLKLEPVDALCAKCHTKYDDAAFIHKPVKKGECLSCHSPHGSDVKALLLRPRDQLCAGCHSQDALIDGPVVHAPVAQGRCLSCHDPHESDSKDQLVDTGKKLCLACHDAKAKTGPATASAAFRVDLAKKFVHKPVATGDCQACHVQTHSGDFAALLIKPVNEQCSSCHAKEGAPAHALAHAAKAVRVPGKDPASCTSCHLPHSSDNPHLLYGTTKKAAP